MALTEEDIIHVPGVASRWVRLGNGAKAHYITAGDTGPAVVLLHGGLPGSSGTAGWRLMAPFLGENGFRVYCPDMPGFGWADTREEHWPVNGVLSHVEFIHDFVNALCLDRFHLAGNSMGADNTIQYVMEHSERVISFVLIATRAIGDNVERERWVTGTYRPETFDGTPESMGRMIGPIIYRQGAIPQELLEMRATAANRQRDSHAAYRASSERIWQDANLAQRLSTKDRFPKVTIPGAYLYGKDDVLAPVENAYMQEDTIPNIQMFYPPECGHQGQTDQPDMFNRLLLEFFRDGKVSRKTADWAGVSTRRPELPALVEQAAEVRA